MRWLAPSFSPLKKMADAPPPAKRARPGDGGGERGSIDDPITAALHRLAPHFAGPAHKHVKALDLLTRLLENSGAAASATPPALTPAHARPVLGAACAAMGGHPERWAPGKSPEAAAAARAAGRLWAALAAARPAMFPPPLREASGLGPPGGAGAGAGSPAAAPPAAILAPLQAWSATRVALATDDSFAFASAVAALTAAVEGLPRPLPPARAGTADADEGAALADLAGAPGRAKDAAAAAAAAAGGGGGPAAAAEAACVSWSPAAAAAALRCALLDAFAYLVGPGYARPWSRAGVDAAVGGPLRAAAEGGAFGGDGAAQHERARALQRAVASARAARGAGKRPGADAPGGGGGGGFQAEAARWAGAAVSKRGSVGMGGGGGGGAAGAFQVLGGG